MARNRLFISTDMQMITGVNHVDGDKDDVQSLIHALFYQDKFNIVGIASTTSQHQPGANDAKFIRHVISEYSADQPVLAAHGKPGDFKTAEQLRAITYQGTKTTAGASGVPGATAASAAIIKEAHAAKAAGETLYVVTWGGVGDVARALSDAPDIAGSIRLISSSGPAQEKNAYKYIKSNFAGQDAFWWIDSSQSFKGIYSHEHAKLPLAVTLSEIETFAKPYGHLGRLFYENSQDLRGTGDTYSGLKMGDSPSILYLIDKADDDNPTAESWGGEYREVGAQYWTDRTDPGSALNYAGSNGARTIYEDRSAWLGDFKARLKWLKDAGVSQPPAKPDSATDGNATGSSRLKVTLSGDHYQGAPKAEIFVDGETVGTYLLKADHRRGEWQDIVVGGDWKDGIDHVVKVVFLNDAWGGKADVDRNLWIKNVSLNGAVAGSPTVLRHTGDAVTWKLDDTPEGPTDTIAVKISGHAYKGDPTFTLLLDGKAVAAKSVVTADHDLGEWQTFTFKGAFDLDGPQIHKVGVQFTNDLYDGPGKDRNLFVDAVTFNGIANTKDSTIDKNMTAYWDFTL